MAQINLQRNVIITQDCLIRNTVGVFEKPGLVNDSSANTAQESL